MKVILTDGNAVGYQSQQAGKLTTADGRPTQAIFHSIKAMWNLKRRYKQHIPYVLWDSHCQWRYDLLPEYKGKRDTYPQQIQMRKEYREQRPFIKEAFNLMGIPQVEHEGFEADDIAGVYATKIESMIGSEAVLYTGDKDWLQLVAENVIWHDLHTDKRVGVKNFERETGFETVTQFLQAKALHGDTSDNIGGVGGIGEKTADKLIKNFGSVKALFEHHAKYGDFEKGDMADPSLDRKRKAINAFCNDTDNGKALLLRNLKLMNLRTITPPEKGFFRKQSKPDLDGFIEFCTEHEMTTLITKAERIFKDLEKR